jgi:glycosyltransferase involved in cell wall biosynthesis
MMTSDFTVSSETPREFRPLQRHILTPEYPPQPGGVSDYTAQIAGGLAREGEEVHVWCPATGEASQPAGGVHVHRDLGRLTSADLRALGAQLDRFPAPRRLLVQWVPHGYGRRSMNVPFCTWLERRVKNHGDSLEIMVHEAFLTFEGSWRQYIAALVHRLMTVILLRAATRVWVSIPECERRWKSYTFGRRVPFQWLPVPSNIRVANDESMAQAIRRLYSPEGQFVVGHFGTYGAPMLSVLEPVILRISREMPDQPLLLMGMNSQEFREKLIVKHPELEPNLHATGPLAPEDLSSHIAACEVMIQPYPDGATTRRTSLMVGLAHGKPVVTTRSNVTEPLWEQSAAVAMTPCGDSDAFVKLLRDLLQDSKERVRMRHAAVSLYHERFDVAHAVTALRQNVSQSVACAS